PSAIAHPPPVFSARPELCALGDGLHPLSPGERLPGLDGQAEAAKRPLQSRLIHRLVSHVSDVSDFPYNPYMRARV
ncbi:hypothetical protein, partial [Gluconobacter sp.]|uniref:hypothetical protein n=1 Tax=Gluconobacter sp. TaxID=1876758 RepID=UPI0039EB87AC